MSTASCRWASSSRQRSTIEIAVVSPTDVALRPRPGELRDVAACGPSVQVTLLEVDPTVAPGEAGLVGGLAEGCPAKRHVGSRDGAGLELGASRWKRDRSPKCLAPGEESQDLRPGRAEGAVARAELREGWRRER